MCGFVCVSVGEGEEKTDGTAANAVPQGAHHLPAGGRKPIDAAGTTLAQASEAPVVVSAEKR